MYQRILVPLKQDETDEVVIEHAAHLARLTGGSVTLIHVVHSHSRDEAVYREEQARQYLGTWAARLSGQDVTAGTRVVLGEPAEAITTVAREGNMDLIVMATHGHSEVRHLFTGSVTEDVVRNGELPVLLVRPPEDAKRHSSAAS
jgi:nucleotide-binding universal stress UspA family protein